MRRVTGYTLRNLAEEVEDSSPKSGMGDTLEGRFATGSLEFEKGGMSLQRLKPDARMPFGHRHAQQEEVYVVVGGNGRIKVDDEIVELRRWDAVRVSPDVVRNLEAGADGMDVLVFGAPHTGPGDVEMLSGWWSD
jgi:mannose-6-phosphate isomerase-like protein (cupin superfamily)